MVEESAGVLVIQLIKEHFTGMGKGGVTDVVTQGNGLDQIQVQVQRTANGPGDSGHQLDMKAPTGDIVILYQGEHLGLVGITVIIGAVHDPVDVLGKGRPPHRRRCFIAETAQCHVIRERKIHKGSGLLFILNPGR